MGGRLPESVIPPAHVLEVRTLGRLYCALMDERRGWQQRIQAQLFHQGAPPIAALLTQTGRQGLASAELSAAGRQYVEAALGRVDELTEQIAPLRTQLVTFAGRQPGCQALQCHYGIGPLCAVIIWAEVGDARRFATSGQLVRYAGLDVTVYSSAGKRSPGHLSRQGSAQLQWAAFEAAKSATHRGSPDYTSTSFPMTSVLGELGRRRYPERDVATSQETDVGGAFWHTSSITLRRSSSLSSSYIETQTIHGRSTR
jgi:transposase